jgi:hypothetical protein
MTTPTNIAVRHALVFLQPPLETEIERTEALQKAGALTREAIGHAVRAGRDDIAFRLLAIALEAEACRASH